MDQIFLPEERSWIYPPLPFFGRQQQQQPEAVTQSSSGPSNVQAVSGAAASDATNDDQEVSRTEPANIGETEGRVRKRRRKDVTVTIKEDAIETPASAVSWEEETRNSLGLASDEFSQFVESQG